MSRVVVVTGGGNGIGAAVAAECKRQGWYVVTVDPMVSLDGSEKVADAPPGAGDRAVDLSVTDADGVRALFDELGRVDAVINVAGISRPTSFTRGSEQDWRAVLDVHLNGYLSVLGAALPVMEAAGYGRIVGVTSGSGWRAADTGAYGCAKRAVAALTWQLGRACPPGVTLNAMSPIAVTRMVTAALGRAPAPAAGGSSTTGGLNLGSMPQPEEIGPLGAHLVREELGWMSGEIIFAGGSESAVVERPRLLEVMPIASLPQAGAALIAAETTQISGGGSNPRFTEAPAGAPAAIKSCAIASDRPEVAAAVTAALKARGVECLATSASEDPGDVDALVVAIAAPRSSSAAGWQRVLQEHAGIVDGILTDARWAHSLVDLARPMRLVMLTDASTAGGASRAQAFAQLARSARKATDDRVAAFAVSDEGNDATTAAEIVAHLLCTPDAVALSGAELVAGPGWVGLRSHPRPSASIVLGAATVPEWFDDTLRGIVQ